MSLTRQKISWALYRPGVNHDMLRACNFKHMPKNACVYYHLNEQTFYEYNMPENIWSDVTRHYDWKKILRTKIMEPPLNYLDWVVYNLTTWWSGSTLTDQASSAPQPCDPIVVPTETHSHSLQSCYNNRVSTNAGIMDLNSPKSAL